MAEADRRRWDERNRVGDYDFTPNGWLASLAERIRPARPGARALDVACGGGRNALFLAELGYAVDAWDVSDVGLAILRGELERRVGAGPLLGIRPGRVDLDDAALPSGAYELVAVLFFLDRALFRRLVGSLTPGGLLLVQTFVDLGDETGPGVRPEYKLRPGELRETFARLEILEDAEDPASGTARLLARRPAG